MAESRVFIFLQGPDSFFSRHFASYLEQQGATCLRINLCFSDWLYWLGKTSVNYRGTFEQWPEFLKSFVLENNVTTILYYADCFPYHKVAREVAAELSIDAVAYENGYLRPNWLTIEKGGMSRYSSFPSDPDEILQKAKGLPAPEDRPIPSANFWVEAFWEVTCHLGNYFFHWTFHRYHADKYYNPLRDYLSIIPRLFNEKKAEKHAEQVIDRLINSGTGYWVFPMQMQNDYQLRENAAFNHQSEAMEMVMQHFAHSAPENDKLIYKIHPADNGIEPWGKILARLENEYRLEGRVEFIDGGNLMKLVNHSKGVFTINSTVGLHALQALKPVYVLGCAVYDIKGLTSDQTLADFFKAPVAPDENLLNAYVNLLAASIQVKGNWFTKAGREIAITGLADKLLNNQVNSHGTYADNPQRNLHKCSEQHD